MSLLYLARMNRQRLQIVYVVLGTRGTSAAGNRATCKQDRACADESASNPDVAVERADVRRLIERVEETAEYLDIRDATVKSGREPAAGIRVLAQLRN